jgi:hypothetical protein
MFLMLNMDFAIFNVLKVQNVKFADLFKHKFYMMYKSETQLITIQSNRN